MLTFILAAACYAGVRSLKVDIKKNAGQIALETLVVATVITLIF